MVSAVDDGDSFFGDAIVRQQLPQQIPIHTVFFKMYETDIDSRVPFNRLFNDNPECGYLACTGSVIPEASPLFPQFPIYCLLEPLKSDTVEQLSWC